MKRILPILAAGLIMAVALQSCSGSKKADSMADAEVVDARNTELARALSEGDIRQASVMADSMSLFVDDFTPEQTVQVLTAFISVHEDALARHERRRDLETLRKYVDVYDIALSVNPNDTREAFAKAKRRNPAIDFDSIAADFRTRLQQYDAMQDGSLVTEEPEATDSAAVKTDSVAAPAAEEVPLEHRPAE